MSYNNPNVSEVINNSTCYRNMTKYLHKSYLNLARVKFITLYSRRPNIEDSEELMRLFGLQWYDYYINNPRREKLYREYTKELWAYGIALSVCVQSSTLEFVRQHNPQFIGVWHYHYDVYILKNNMFEQYKQYIQLNRKKFHYRKRRYVDFSHLAYNGVADDF